MTDDDLWVTEKRLKTPSDADCWIDGMVLGARLEAAGHSVEAMSFFYPMYLCPSCGNKRCPKATWHENECTHSNEPMQPGSHYGGLTPEQTAALMDQITKETT